VNLEVHAGDLEVNAGNLEIHVGDIVSYKENNYV